MKPFIKYPGGKLKEFSLIERFKPTNIKRYFETFVGGGSIYFNINISTSFINDKSEDLISLYNYVKNQDNKFFNYLNELDFLWKQLDTNSELNTNIINKEKFISYTNKSFALKSKRIQCLENEGNKISNEDKENIKLTAKKTAFYMCIRDIYNDQKENKQLHTACFYFIREYCYGSMFRYNSKGEFNIPYGGMSYNRKNMKSKIDNMFNREIDTLFSNTDIHCSDFENFFKDIKLTEKDFVFLDPPYDTDFSDYEGKDFTKNDQERLAYSLKKTLAKFILVIKNTDFISSLYDKDFNILSFDKQYTYNVRSRNNRDVEHLIITNLPV